MLEIFLVKFFPLMKEFAPWLVIIGGAIRWWFTKKKDDEATSMSRIETLSKVEERLRQSLEKQLAVTEAKLELANKEVERLKLIVASHAIEVEKLKAELSIEIAKNKRG